MALLRSKVRPPTVPVHAIERPRLLDRVLQSDSTLVLLQASAGYGKSVLAAQIHAAEPHRTAWLFLEPEDAEPRRFCRYLAGALTEILPTLARTELSQSLTQEEFDPTDWLEDLILFFQEFPARGVRLVLDNFESVSEEPLVTRLIERLLQHSEGALRLLITSRVPVSIGARRLSERGHGLILDGDDLAFSMGEFKNAARAHGQELTDEALEELWEHSEGWCVCLGLGPEAITNRSGYLEEEILGRLAEDTLRFLKSTSVLDVVSSAGVRALGLGQESLAPAIEELDRGGVPYLRVVEDEEEGIRLHPLIRQKLLEELRTDPEPGLARKVAERVASFYRSAGREEDAIRLLIELREFELVLELLARDWAELEEQRLLPRVSSWLRLLPAELNQHPLYILSQVRSLQFQGENRKVVEVLEGLRSTGAYPETSRIYPQLWITEAFARTVLGRFQYEDLTAEWKTLHPRSNEADRITAEFMLATAALYDLRFEAAKIHIENTLAMIPPESTGLRARAMNAMTTVLHEDGNTKKSLEITREAIEFCTLHDEKTYRTFQIIGRAFNYKDMGRFKDALASVEEGLDLERGSGATRMLLLPHAARIRGEVAWYRGQWSRAFAELEKAHRYFLDHNLYEGLATGVLIDHWRSIRGERSDLVSDSDFPGALGVSEARVRYLIRRSRAETSAGDPKAAVITAREGRDLAVEMPSWRATTWFTEAWAQSALGHKAETLAALDTGLGLLDNLERPAYPMADPELTGWIVAEAVASDLRVARAVTLVSGETLVDIQPAFQQALRSPGRSSEECTRLISVASQLSIRGLSDVVQAADVPESVKHEYATRLQTAPLPPLTVRMFGAFEIMTPGREVRFQRKSSRRILQILLVEYPTPVHEERLIDLMWPNFDAQKGKRNLQTSVNEIRRSLDPHLAPRGESYVYYREEGYGLFLPAGSHVYLHEFRREIAELLDPGTIRDLLHTTRLTRTLEFYHGDLLAEEPYEEFATEPRERERTRMLEAAAALARSLEARAPAEADRVLRHALDADPFWSEGVALLIRVLRDQGRILAAIRVYRDYEKRLEQELGVPPDQPLATLFEELIGIH